MSKPKQVRQRPREPRTKASGYFLAFFESRDGNGKVIDSRRVERRLVNGEWVDVKQKGPR